MGPLLDLTLLDSDTSVELPGSDHENDCEDDIPNDVLLDPYELENGIELDVLLLPKLFSFSSLSSSSSSALFTIGS